MDRQTVAYIAVLHAIQHVILSAEADEIDRETAEREVAELARKVPKIDREWRERS